MMSNNKFYVTGGEFEFGRGPPRFLNRCMWLPVRVSEEDLKCMEETEKVAAAAAAERQAQSVW